MSAELVYTVIDAEVAPEVIDAEVVPLVVEAVIDASQVGRQGPEAEVPVPYNREGPLAVGVGVQGYPVPFDCTVIGVRGYLGSAPTGSEAVFDVNRNGVTIFSDPATRPRAAAGSQVIPEASGMSVTALNAGDVLTVDIDQIGSGSPGADATLVIRIRKG
jgi:hypothetical protein